jgi:hypothetical protein
MATARVEVTASGELSDGGDPGIGVLTCQCGRQRSLIDSSL